MSRSIEWFNRTAPEGAAPLPALTGAGIVQLYFESIHPFEDGNGRIGRCNLLAGEGFLAFGGPEGSVLAAPPVIARPLAIALAVDGARRFRPVRPQESDVLVK